MKIARIRHIFYPDIPKDYFYELSAQQTNRGHEVHVLTWGRNGANSIERVKEGFFVHRLPGLNFKLGQAITNYPILPTIAMTISQLNPDVIHAESHLFAPSLQAARSAKKNKIPVVVTVHGVLAERNFAVNALQHAYIQTFGTRLWSWADQVICLTKSDSDEIIQLGCPIEKLNIISNAVDTNLFKPTENWKDNLVVWVGRFVPEKGVNILIDAASIVQKKDPNARFLLIGYGPLRQNLIEQAKKVGVFGNSLSIVGPLVRTEIAKILRTATVFAFPSLKEGLPLAVLESLASGVPVVGSNITGVSSVVQDGFSGYLFPKKNPVALASKIMSLIEDQSQRSKFSLNARAYVTKNNSWENILNKLDCAYQTAISCHR